MDETVEFVEGCKRDPQDIWKRPMYANTNDAGKTEGSQESLSLGSTMDIRKLYDSV